MTSEELSAIRERARESADATRLLQDHPEEYGISPPLAKALADRDALLGHIDALPSEPWEMLNVQDSKIEALEKQVTLLTAERDALASQLLDVAQGWVPVEAREERILAARELVE